MFEYEPHSKNVIQQLVLFPPNLEMFQEQLAKML